MSIEARHRAILESAVDGIVTFDTDGVVESANPAITRHFGVAVSDLVGQSIELLIQRPSVEPLLAYLEGFRNARKVSPIYDIAFEVLHKHRDGRELYFMLSVSRFRLGGAQKFTGILHNLTESKAREKAIRIAKERFDLAVRGSSDGLWDWDIPTDEVFFSPRFKELIGFQDHEFENRYEVWEERLHPDDKGPTLAALEQHLHGHGPYDVEYRLRTRSDDWRWFRARGQAIWDKEGEPTRMAGSLTDISEAKRSREELERFNEMLEERVAERTRELEAVNEELAQYAYVVSHDLKTPLRAINNYATFLGEDLPADLSGDLKEYFEGICGAVREAETLVNDLLDLSRIGRSTMDLETLDLADETRACLEVFAEIPDATVDVTVDDDAGSLDSERTLLRQILLNLVGNGLKFNQSSPKSVQVHWRSLDAERVELSVRDNGIGIDPKYQERIFQVFHRLHTAAEYDGTGIGLAIVRKATLALGGELTLESAEGEGTTFSITLPRRPSTDEGNGAEPGGTQS